MILKYLENPNSTNQKNSPLSIILGFSGGSEKIISKYSNLWFKRGFNSLILSLNPPQYSSYFFKDYSKLIVEFIINYFKNNDNKIIFFHSISIGTTLFMVFLKYIQENKEYSYIMKYIKGTVYDSSPLVYGCDYFCGFFATIGTIENVDKCQMNFYSEKAIEFLNRCWDYECKYNYPFLISPINKWNHLVITSPNDNVTISIDSFFDDVLRNNNSIKLYEHTDNNNENDKNQLYLIKKVFNSAHCCHFLKYPNEYQDSINQLIDLHLIKISLIEFKNNNNNNKT
ncbi:hypothetical protein ACTFIW_003957 [Dictyostelium discoideum]